MIAMFLLDTVKLFHTQVLCSVTDLLKALLGNTPVHTFQHTRHAAIRWKCFLCVRAWTVATQRMRGDVTQQCVGVT
jgi:hypothetical protein